MMAVFAGHLGLVSSGAVCVRPGMATMSAAVATAPSSGDAGSMRDMPGMPGMHNGVDAPPADQGPCSGRETGQCLASMPCVTVLGSHAIATLLPALGTSTGDDASWAALMPASSSTAPELPPPRA